LSDATRQPPYPADTRAKGWRFELDYEKIDQSDTWGLAAEVPLARPCLVMMWLVAWTQEPCGSLPNNEALIRARCSIPSSVWPKVRELLMRGWWVADDGRLYHDTVSARVLEMIEYRRKNAERVAAFKAAKREQQAANALPAKQQHDKNDTGTGTGTSKEEKAQRKRSAPPPEGVADQTWCDWLDLRRKKRAPVTATVVDSAKAEAAKAGMTLDAFLRIWCFRGSQGLQADWLKPNEIAAGKAAPTAITVDSAAADHTQAYLRSQQMTPEQEAAAAAARKAFLEKHSGKAAAGANA
jgi:hypothetical protein